MTLEQPQNPILPVQEYRAAVVVGKKPLHFTFAPDAAARAAIAAHLNLIDLPAFQLKGALTPKGRGDVVLQAVLSAQIVQSCAISLEPVPSSLKGDVLRDYLRDFADPTALEAELGPEDQEPIPEVFDVAAIAIEELSLALPPYPRAIGAEMRAVTAAPAGAVPLTDEALRPFAGLSNLAEAMKSRAQTEAASNATGGTADDLAGEAALDKGKMPK